MLRKVLVGTLYSGENEFEACCRMIEKQQGCAVTHHVIQGLGNKEAHDELYRFFGGRRHAYDYFVKVDADMVLKDEASLARIVGLFEQNEAMDHLCLSVDDWYTDSPIMGLNAFSSRVQWLPNNESLFVDLGPKVPGEKSVVWDAPAPIADHCPDPSPFQAFHFGVHRALKALQPGRWPMVLHQFEAQSRYLRRTWDHFCKAKDLRLGWAILGATLVLRGEVAADAYDYTNPALMRGFERYASLTSQAVVALAEPMWGTEAKFQRFLARKTFVRRVSTLGRDCVVGGLKWLRLSP